MDKRTGEIVSEELAKRLFGDKYRERVTPLSDIEHEKLAALNRHERRAELVKMRREARAKAKGETV